MHACINVHQIDTRREELSMLLFFFFFHSSLPAIPIFSVKAAPNSQLGVLPCSDWALIVCKAAWSQDPSVEAQKPVRFIMP